MVASAETDTQEQIASLSDFQVAPQPLKFFVAPSPESGLPSIRRSEASGFVHEALSLAALIIPPDVDRGRGHVDKKGAKTEEDPALPLIKRLFSSESPKHTVAVTNEGLVIFPETGALYIRPDTPREDLIKILNLPEPKILDPQNCVQLELSLYPKEHITQLGVGFDEIGEEGSLTVHNAINELNSRDPRNFGKVKGAVLRYLRSTVTGQGTHNNGEPTISEIQLSRKPGDPHKDKGGSGMTFTAKVTIEEGKTVVRDMEGNKINLAEYPEDVVAMYDRFFPGPKDGESTTGLSILGQGNDKPSLRDVAMEYIENPALTRTLEENAHARQTPLHTEIVGPAKALNQLLKEEQRTNFRINPASERVAESLLRKDVLPVIVPLGGSIALFYDQRTDSFILCTKDNGKWHAVRADGDLDTFGHYREFE